jgi:hypothetical protein
MLDAGKHQTSSNIQSTNDRVIKNQTLRRLPDNLGIDRLELI